MTRYERLNRNKKWNDLFAAALTGAVVAVNGRVQYGNIPAEAVAMATKVANEALPALKVTTGKNV